MVRLFKYYMSKYARTKDVKITMPLGLYDEMVKIIASSDKWVYPQNFIISAIEEKINHWKKNNPEKE
ncbi:MAG: hypothetical protein QXU18_12015 [Thermoplasmatales archaeon]